MVATELEDKVEQCLNISKKKKKSSKKKSSGPAPAPLAPFYEQALQQYPVKLNNTKAKGRHAVASTKLDAGVVVCQEQASAFVVRSEYIDQQCHVCLSDLEQKMMCSDCKTTYYCSEACLKKDEEVHILVCGPFAQVQAIGRATDVEPDMLRLMTLLMARKYLDQQQETKTSGGGPTPYWCVEDLLSHKENADPAFIRVIQEASQRLVMEMPEKIHLPVDDMVTLACRINSNAHGLGDNHSRNTDVALGLFPLGALFFNHGCNPNTAFIGMPNGQLAFRTIRPVSKDEELVVSYIDLYADRDERRQELWMTKHFWCKCKRCSGPMERSVDRFLQGVVCTQCQSDVYMIPSTPVEHLTKGVRNAYASKGNFSCSHCGHEIACESVSEILEDANKTYMLGMAAIRQERNYKRGGDKLEEIVNSDSTKGGNLHHLNAFRFNSYIPLMNCKRYNNDLKGAIQVNKAILDMMQKYAEEGSLPSNTSEISDFWQNLGELYTKMAQGKSSLLEKKWQKEAKNAYQQAYQIRLIVFGQEHPKTKILK